MSTDVEPLVPQGVRLTATGLTITNPDLPPDQAEQIGFVLGDMHMSVRFAIGDWLIWIEQAYPETWSQISEAVGLSEEGRREYRRVSSSVPHSVRRENVSWSHHRAVAALKVVDAKTGNTVPDYKQQRELLKRVETERLSHHALRDALRNGNPIRETRRCRCCGRDYDS